MSIPFLQAKHFRKGRGGKSILWIVIHAMQAPEKPDTAEGVARYFQNPPRVGSAHFCVDSNSEVRCVKDEDQAAGAAGANRQGLHMELAGYSEQSGRQWEDEYSTAMLKRGAVLCAVWAKRYGIPAVWLSPADLKAGKKGFASHDSCSKAFGGSHWDPGKEFPHARFLGWVREAMGETTMPEQQIKPITVTLDGRPTEIRGFLRVEEGVSYVAAPDLAKMLKWPSPQWHPPRGVDVRTK